MHGVRKLGVRLVALIGSPGSMDGGATRPSSCTLVLIKEGAVATLSRIAPEIPVDDLNEAVTYYDRKLGFELAMEITNEYAIVERDGIAIHLFSDRFRTSSRAGLHIFTHQLDELQDELFQRGATISSPITLRPWGNRDFRVIDSAGNTLKFTEPVALFT